MITDPAHPGLSDYRVVREPELGQAHGVFIAEGRLVVRRLLTRSSLVVKSVLVTPAALRSIEDVLDARPDVARFVVSQEVMNSVAGFNIHRGCLAAGHRPPSVDWHRLAAIARRLILIEHVGDADNIGAMFRSGAALGADAMVIGPGCADPLYRKAIRTSMGASLTLPFAAAGPWPATLTELVDAGWAVAALTPEADALPLPRFAEWARDRRTALALGHEGDGLSAPAIAACSHRVRIPMRAGVDSLNVATAAAIALYELSRDE